MILFIGLLATPNPIEYFRPHKPCRNGVALNILILSAPLPSALFPWLKPVLISSQNPRDFPIPNRLFFSHPPAATGPPVLPIIIWIK